MHHLRARGLLGSLLDDGCVLRFCSQAEIAAIHGAVRPLRISSNLKVDMRLLGNSIAVPHAAAALAYGLGAIILRG